MNESTPETAERDQVRGESGPAAAGRDLAGHPVAGAGPPAGVPGDHETDAGVRAGQRMTEAAPGTRAQHNPVAHAPEGSGQGAGDLGPVPGAGRDRAGATRGNRAQGASEPFRAAGTQRVRPGHGEGVTEFASESMDEPEFRAALEAILLVVDTPAPVEQLATALDEPESRVEQALREMSAELAAQRSGIDLRFAGDGWRFYTRSEYAPYVERMLLDGARSKLTRAALETLAVVAYRQPVTRSRVSAVRGVNVDGVMRTLLARGLITEAGTDPETNGTLYGTTELFLERIGLASLSDLPELAPLLPGVDLIDEINDSLETDPRYTRLRKPAEDDLNLGAD